MSVGRPDLNSKLAGIYRYLYEFELLIMESNEYALRLDQTGDTLKKTRRALARNIIMPLVFLSGVIVILSGTGGIQNIFQGVKTAFSGFMDALQLLTVFALFVLSVISLIKIPVNLTLISKSKNSIADNQKMFDGVLEKFTELFTSMAAEKADAEEMFPGADLEYPFSKYVKYAIDELNSGREEEFREIMSLIDELTHRDKMRAEAEKKTRAVKQAAISSGKTFVAVRNAERAVRRAAGNAS